MYEPSSELPLFRKVSNRYGIGGVCWITCYRCLFPSIAIRAGALDNVKRQKGYRAVTRTTHICSGTEK